MKIYAPNKSFTGTVAGVPFVNGEGEASGDRLNYFRRHGYQLGEPADPEPDPEPTDDPEPEPEPDGPDWDPGDYSVDDVIAKLAAADDDGRAAIIAAEQAGKARKGIVHAKFDE